MSAAPKMTRNGAQKASPEFIPLGTKLTGDGRTSNRPIAIGGPFAVVIPNGRTRLKPVSVTIEIPDDFAVRLQTRREEAEAQLHLELAIALYRKGHPVACAASLAALKLAEFEELRRQRGVTTPYTLEHLEHDVAYASGRR
jgi:predicted HTH domain antitoxin